MPNDDSRSRDVALLQKHVDALGEHFDTVQIFCTRHDHHNLTVAVQLGAGNWYARYGHVMEWLERQAEPGNTGDDEATFP